MKAGPVSAEGAANAALGVPEKQAMAVPSRNCSSVREPVTGNTPPDGHRVLLRPLGRTALAGWIIACYEELCPHTEPCPHTRALPDPADPTGVTDMTW